MDLASSVPGDRPAADVLAELSTVPFISQSPPASPDDGWTRDLTSGAELLEVARIIRDPTQPRTQFDQSELDQLAESVTARGILQPVRVQWLADPAQWMLLAGERRWRAAQAAGLAAIPAVRANASLTEAEALQEQIAEQLLHADWNPIEEAKAYRRLVALTGWSQRDVAAHCHVTQTGVHRALKLLQLDPRVQDLVAERRVKVSAALELVGLPPASQIAIAEQAASVAARSEQTAENTSNERLIHFESPALARAKRPRTVVKINTRDGSGKVIVEAAGDVAANLKEALRVHRRAQRPTPPAAAA